MANVLRLLCLVTAVCLARTARAQVNLGDDTQLLSVTGQVSADRKAAEQFGSPGISIAFTGDSPDHLVWIGVVKAQSWNGDVFAGREMLAMIQGHTPSMLASGRPALLTKLKQAPVGSRIVVEGIFDQGARTYSLGMVQTTPGR